MHAGRFRLGAFARHLVRADHLVEELVLQLAAELLRLRRRRAVAAPEVFPDDRVHVHRRVPAHAREHVVVQVVEEEAVALRLRERAEHVGRDHLVVLPPRPRRHRRHAHHLQLPVLVRVRPYPDVPDLLLPLPDDRVVARKHVRLANRVRARLRHHHHHVRRDVEVRHAAVPLVRHLRDVAGHLLADEPVRDVARVAPYQLRRVQTGRVRLVVLRPAVRTAALVLVVVRHDVHVLATAERVRPVPLPAIALVYLAHVRAFAGQVALDVLVQLLHDAGGEADHPMARTWIALVFREARPVLLESEPLGMLLAEPPQELEADNAVAARDVERPHAQARPAVVQSLALGVLVVFNPAVVLPWRRIGEPRVVVLADDQLRRVCALADRHAHLVGARHYLPKLARPVEATVAVPLEELVHGERRRPPPLHQPAAVLLPPKRLLVPPVCAVRAAEIHPVGCGLDDEPVVLARPLRVDAFRYRPFVGAHDYLPLPGGRARHERHGGAEHAGEEVRQLARGEARCRRGSRCDQRLGRAGVEHQTLLPSMQNARQRAQSGGKDTSCVHRLLLLLSKTIDAAHSGSTVPKPIGSW